MRKGILSLSFPSRGKTAGKRKTTNMGIAEQAVAKKATVAEEPKVEAKEKAFVQTIMVPKQNTPSKNIRRVMGIKTGRGRNPQGTQK